MGSPPVIVDRPIPNRHLQMAFVERKQEVETFATKVAAESFAHRVRLGGPQRRPQNPYTQIGKTSVDIRREYAVAIVDDEAVGMVARQRFPELLQRPFRRGMGRGVEVENLAGSDLHDDEDVEGPEGGGDHHEEVAGHHDLGMIADEGQPTLFRVRRAHRTLSAEALADGAWGELNGQLQIQLVGDAFLSPSRILCGHFLNESAQVLGDARSANRSGFPAPEETESVAVPTDERVRLDVQGVTPGEQAAQNYHNQPSGIIGAVWLHLPLLEQNELLTQEEVLGCQRAARPRNEYEEMDEIARYGRQRREALCQRSKDGAGHKRPALHVTRLYVMANWRLNGISADHRTVDECHAPLVWRRRVLPSTRAAATPRRCPSIASSKSRTKYMAEMPSPIEWCAARI